MTHTHMPQSRLTSSWNFQDDYSMFFLAISSVVHNCFKYHCCESRMTIEWNVFFLKENTHTITSIYPIHPYGLLFHTQIWLSEPTACCHASQVTSITISCRCASTTNADIEIFITRFTVFFYPTFFFNAKYFIDFFFVYNFSIGLFLKFQFPWICIVKMFE